ncbi:MAG: alpha/beta fold hydrolase [Antricoccus sp.]
MTEAGQKSAAENSRGPTGRIAKVVRRVDPIGWLPATAAVAREAVRHPRDIAQAGAKYASTMAKVPPASVVRLFKSDSVPPVDPGPRDKRFADPTWDANPIFFGIRQAYLATCNLVDEVAALGKENVDQMAVARAEQFIKLLQNVASPTNFAPTNPEVLSKAMQTGGKSLFSGARFAADDLRHRGGRPLKVDRNDFEMGKTLAATKGQVVFRNNICELIQFAPQTAKVHQNPVLFSPPWINKYYVMDLAPERSLAEWAVRHGRTVFVLSYKNPDTSMASTTFSDYLRDGSINAISVIKQITGANKIDIVGLCLGGVSATIATAYLAAKGDESVNSLTLLNTMLDYRDPGELGMMTDSGSVTALEERMSTKGYLSGDDLAFTFDLMRSRDLIFNYVVSRWLKGEPPPAFDILAWNEDSTHLTAAFHGEYMRELYTANALIKGDFVFDGVTLDLAKIDMPLYMVSAINDHIVPWQAAYSAVNAFGAPVRYVLSSGGHIAGVVNPPTPKAWLEIAEVGPNPDDPNEWREQATRASDTWWNDWITWSEAHGGPMVAPPPMGSKKHPPIADAPGSYVLT